MTRVFTFALLLFLFGTAPAYAHLNPIEHGSFVAGFSHPLFGLDHALAMIAVGLWAVTLGSRAIWLLPTAFVSTMTLGFVASISGLPLLLVEPLVLASVMVIGTMVAFALPIPYAPATAAVAVFAFFHGHAHGGEIGQAGVVGYATGFFLATSILHATGIVIGKLANGLLRGHSLAGTRIVGVLTVLGAFWLVAVLG